MPVSKAPIGLSQWGRHLAPCSVLVLMSFSGSVRADCGFDSGARMNSAVVTLPGSLNVKRDAAVGTILFDSGWANGGSTRVGCFGSGLATYGYSSFMQAVPGQAHVYQTGVQGVGIKAAYSNSYGSQPSNIDSVNLNSGSSLMDWPRLSQAYTSVLYTPAGLYRVQLVVTGPLATGSNTMTLPSPAARTYYGSLLSNQAVFTNTTVVVQTVACTVTTPSVTVHLRPVKISDFKGVGSSIGQTPFTVRMNCPKGAVVSYQFDGTSPAGVSGTGLLANGTGANMATGVAVQLVNASGTSAFPLATKTSLGTATVDNQPMNIDLFARYYQTQGRIRGGKVSSTAYVTMHYQ